MKNESALYKSLVEKFTDDKKKNGYLENYNDEYKKTIEEVDNKDVEHAICILSSDLEIVAVEGIIATIFSIGMELLLKVCIEIAKRAFPVCKNSIAEMCIYLVGVILVFIVWGSFLVRLTSVKRQKFFLGLMQLDLKRREEEKNEVKNEVRQLNIGVSQQIKEHKEIFYVSRKSKDEEIEISIPIEKDMDYSKLLEEIRKILDW